jgi:hypothetical protein
VELIDGHYVVTFQRNTAASDVLAIVRSADTPAGPWTDIAQSAGGAPFNSLSANFTVTESGAGAIRSVELRDLRLNSDQSQPQRFFRLWIQAQ